MQPDRDERTRLSPRKTVDRGPLLGVLLSMALLAIPVIYVFHNDRKKAHVSAALHEQIQFRREFVYQYWEKYGEIPKEIETVVKDPADLPVDPFNHEGPQYTRHVDHGRDGGSDVKGALMIYLRLSLQDGYIISYGPDGDRDIDDIASNVETARYDPTNGILSGGDIVQRIDYRDWPKN